MKKFLLFLLLLISLQSFGQKKSAKDKIQKAIAEVDFAIPLTADNWEFKPNSVEFVEYKGRKSMKINQGSGQIVLKDLIFKDGTIEYDIEPDAAEFADAIYFHRKDANEQEIVYLRVAKMGNPLANEGIQYTPYFNGVNMWDMYPQYQAPSNAKVNIWNHIKLVISGKQMKVYTNGILELQVPKLEGKELSGSIALEGASHIADLVIKPNETEGLSPLEGIDITQHDGHYLRKWAISMPALFPKGTEPNLLPPLDNFTDSIAAETAGLVNLTRRFGAAPERKIVWLNTNIQTKEATSVNLQLGFSDEVWVYLNNQMVLVDKNLFQQAGMRKYPDGRASVQNTIAKLNLKKGNNELLIAVANDFYGWGLIARLDNTENILQTNDISSILSKAKELANIDLNLYLGTFTNSMPPYKLTFTTKEKSLFCQVPNQPAFQVTAYGNHIFKYDQAGVALEFIPTENKVIVKQGSEIKEFVKN
ncbi:MAG: hypothetical protein ABI844_08085 [Saprospiraceae bacterium]